MGQQATGVWTLRHIALLRFRAWRSIQNRRRATRHDLLSSHRKEPARTYDLIAGCIARVISGEGPCGHRARMCARRRDQGARSQGATPGVPVHSDVPSRPLTETSESRDAAQRDQALRLVNGERRTGRRVGRGD